MERSLGGCEGGLAAGGAGRAPRPWLGPGDGLGCGKRPGGSGPFGRRPAHPSVAWRPRPGREERADARPEVPERAGRLSILPRPRLWGPGRLSSPGRLRLPRAPLGPARTRVLGSPPALALRALGAGTPVGVACLPPALPRQQCSGPRALRRLERRAGVLEDQPGAGARSGEAGRAAGGARAPFSPPPLSVAMETAGAASPGLPPP